MTRVLFQQNQWEWRVSQTKKDCAEFFELEKKNGKSPKNQPPSDDADEDYDATRNPPNWECASISSWEPSQAPPPILVLITLAFDVDAVTVAAWYFGILRDLRRRRCSQNVC